MTPFTVVTGGRQHASVAGAETCPACAEGWPRPCSCEEGLIHAEEHAMRGGWGPAVARYRCEGCARISPEGAAILPEGAAILSEGAAILSGGAAILSGGAASMERSA